MRSSGYSAGAASRAIVWPCRVLVRQRYRFLLSRRHSCQWFIGPLAASQREYSACRCCYQCRRRWVRLRRQRWWGIVWPLQTPAKPRPQPVLSRRKACWRTALLYLALGNRQDVPYEHASLSHILRDVGDSAPAWTLQQGVATGRIGPRSGLRWRKKR